MLISYIKTNWKSISKFIIAGIAGAAVDFGVLYLLTDFIRINYLVSSTISFILSLIVNYLMCAYWVFESRQPDSFRKLFLFVITSLIGLALNDLIMWLCVDKIGVYYMLAKVVSTAIVMIWNYFTKKYIIEGRTKSA